MSDYKKVSGALKRLTKKMSFYNSKPDLYEVITDEMRQKNPFNFSKVIKRLEKKYVSFY